MPVNSYQRITVGEWIIDSLQNTLTHNVPSGHDDNNTQPLKVEKRLIRVLLALAQAPQQTCSKQQLLDQVWSGKVVSDDTLSVAISSLRKIMGCDAKQPRYIETITGYGFRLLPEARELQAVEPAFAPVSITSTDDALIQPSFISTRTLVGLLVGALLLISALWMVWQQNSALLKPVDVMLLDNQIYQKARFLLQKNALADLQQAEILLRNLHTAQPENPIILNEYAKSIFYQAAYLSNPEKNQAYTESRQLFHQVLQLDTNHGDTYLQLALIAIAHDRQLQQAQEYFIQSIALNPAEIAAHLRYAELLLALRDFKQAAHHNKIAQSLDPHYYASASIAWVYNMAGQYMDAKQELAKLYSLEPDSLIYHSSALRLYENMGDEAAAFKHYLLAFAAAGYSESELVEARQVFAQGGLRQLNKWLATTKNEQRDIGQYYPPISTARYFTAAGDSARALDYLELAYAQNEYLLLWLNSDPKYQSLHDQPRFTQLLEKLGLN